MTRRIALVLLLATSAFAQAPSTFKDGVLAFEKGEYAKAEQLMKQTIAINPRESEGTVSIAGQWYETYVPQYFLARALAKQGKCAEANKYFEESERQGVTPAIADFARHLKTRGGCRAAKVEKPPKAVDEIEVPFEDVQTTTKSETPPRGAPASQPAATPPSRRPGRQDAGVPAGKDAGAPIETRARLTTAIRAYLEGQYEVTLRVLDAKPFTDRNAAAEAALFRAAARDALYRAGGEKDEALRAAIETDLRVYRELRGKRKPDPRIFPPRFIAMTEK